MCYAHSEKGKYPTDILAKTLETLVKNKDLFKTASGVVTCKVADNLWVPVHTCQSEGGNHLKISSRPQFTPGKRIF